MAEHFKKYWPRYAGSLIGLITGISALVLGFFKTLFLLLCALTGFVIVALAQNDEKVKNILKKLKNLLMKIVIFIVRLWQGIFGKRRY